MKEWNARSWIRVGEELPGWDGDCFLPYPEIAVLEPAWWFMMSAMVELFPAPEDELVSVWTHDQLADAVRVDEDVTQHDGLVWLEALNERVAVWIPIAVIVEGVAKSGCMAKAAKDCEAALATLAVALACRLPNCGDALLLLASPHPGFPDDLFWGSAAGPSPGVCSVGVE